MCLCARVRVCPWARTASCCARHEGASSVLVGDTQLAAAAGARGTAPSLFWHEARLFCIFLIFHIFKVVLYVCFFFTILKLFCIFGHFLYVCRCFFDFLLFYTLLAKRWPSCPPCPNCGSGIVRATPNSGSGIVRAPPLCSNSGSGIVRATSPLLEQWLGHRSGIVRASFGSALDDTLPPFQIIRHMFVISVALYKKVTVSPTIGQTFVVSTLSFEKNLVLTHLTTILSILYILVNNGVV